MVHSSRTKRTTNSCPRAPSGSSPSSPFPTSAPPSAPTRRSIASSTRWATAPSWYSRDLRQVTRSRTGAPGATQRSHATFPAWRSSSKKLFARKAPASTVTRDAVRSRRLAS